MATQKNVEALIESAKRLSEEDRLRLLQALLQQPEQRASSRHHITEIRGLGKELWQGIDAQEYVNAERDAWDS